MFFRHSEFWKGTEDRHSVYKCLKTDGSLLHRLSKTVTQTHVFPHCVFSVSIRDTLCCLDGCREIVTVCVPLFFTVQGWQYETGLNIDRLAQRTWSQCGGLEECHVLVAHVLVTFCWVVCLCVGWDEQVSVERSCHPAFFTMVTSCPTRSHWHTMERSAGVCFTSALRLKTLQLFTCTGCTVV